MGGKLQTYLLSTPAYLKIKHTGQKIFLPGFHGLSLYEVLKFFIRETQIQSLSTRASSVAYKFFLAIFPGLIFLFSLIPYIPIKDFQSQLLLLLKDILPRNAYDMMQETFTDLIKNPRGGLLSIGFVVALYFSTNGIHAMIESFNNSYHSIERRSDFVQRVVSVVLVFLLVILLVISISLIVFSNIALSFLVAKGILRDVFTYYVLQMGQWSTVIILFFLAISFLYYLGPSKKVRMGFLNPGAILATFLCILTSLAFSFYVNNFGQYNKLYGSIGTVMVIMLWIYFNAYILLLGFELNASIYLAKKQKTLPPL